MPEFIDPDWGDKVNSGIGLSHLPARLWAGGPYDGQPYAGNDFIPQSWIYEFGYRNAHTTVTTLHAYFIRFDSKLKNQKLLL
jgi:hypothetical protein